MKTFLNVLYRRILYKIPLKLLLILLAVFGVLFACFSNAGYNGPHKGYWTLDGGATAQLGKNWNDVLSMGPDLIFCLINNPNTSCNLTATFDGNSTSLSTSKPDYVACLSGINVSSTVGVSVKNNAGSSCTFTFMFAPESAFFEQYSSLQCQTEYNLIPISEVDQNYCTINNLCPSQECPDIPSGTGNLTQLYINNILHVGAPTVLMNISDEIDWDYAYTQGGNVMNIDIVGYNVDYQAVEDEIIIQKFKPDSSDLSLIISSIIPLFVPGLCIILLLYFIFKFIKKVF